ncbi:MULTISPECIES: D-hexose-6-phosphate mutarotase [unclassified Guyparkeria]|uniref:D-hexose-6-phosphate mutarotase n=1 Tax=unclassified Guyparkeria TaxID=2626246 RepID=UPI0007337E0C|nr:MULTISPECIES: D-hexose-6-phosphate mutarotase [unclassified Guyparkeria]KTG15900.1 hypothetical protein AUR63_06175 [Guyparkeria sp. XI15]OAE84650.1 hypothetical protein AWR35_06185 [Guyparkeria sp. WRN-7]
MIDQLQRRFRQPGVRLFERDRLVMLELSNAYGSTVITTLGATVLSYIPAGGKEVIWVSESARFDGSKPVRGGIPVCWPWFGPHPDDSALPAHGFARSEDWELIAVSGGTQESRATFRLEPNERTQSMWPGTFRLQLDITLGRQLQVQLQATNLGATPWRVSEALHSYFRVDEARGIGVGDLDGLGYWDKQQGGVRGIQEQPLRVDPPIDRVFFGHRGEAVIHDRDRDIRVGKDGSETTVVWNPGPEGARGFDDIPDDAWSQMLCVETANALDNRYTLAPGQTHVMTTSISSSPCR